jgi:hypothetical protein
MSGKLHIFNESFISFNTVQIALGKSASGGGGSWNGGGSPFLLLLDSFKKKTTFYFINLNAIY